jgi:hypothetical protein
MAGAFYVSPGADQASVLLYRAENSGALSEVIGRRGRGPGEFGVAGVTVMVSDSLHVFDRTLRRLTVFDQDHKAARTVQLADRVDAAIPLSGGRVLIHTISTAPERAGLPLHLMDPGGRILRSFGAENALVDPRQRDKLRRIIGPAPEDRVWSIPWNNEYYEVELWDTSSGTSVVTLRRDAGWYQHQPVPQFRDEVNSEPIRPNPNPVAVWGDSKGLLWVVMATPRDDWRVHAPARRMSYVIEVIDPSAGILLASRRYDGALSKIVAGRENTLHGWTEDEAGMQYLDILELRLTERSDVQRNTPKPPSVGARARAVSQPTRRNR